MLTPAQMESEVRGLIQEALQEAAAAQDDEGEGGKKKDIDDHHDKKAHGQAHTRRLASALRHAEASLRTKIMQQTVSSEEERQEMLLEALRETLEPYQAALRTCLQTIYQADKRLTSKLKEGETQLTRMKQACERPVEVMEALRYAHRIRAVTSAPPGWQPGLRLDFIPPNPFMPGNECIAASHLRQHHLQVQRANRGMYI